MMKMNKEEENGIERIISILVKVLALEEIPEIKQDFISRNLERTTEFDKIFSYKERLFKAYKKVKAVICNEKVST